MSEENEFPEGWVQTTLEEVTAPIRVSVQPREYPTLPFIGMEHVESETMRLLGSVPASELKSNAVRFWPGDVLYGRLRPYLNKVLRPDFEGLCSAEFLVFRESSNLDSHYLQYFLNSWNFREFASHLNEGDRPRVDWSQLKDFRFPLPPLPEQHRIVAAIEQQFTRLDAGVAALQRARIKLKRYRAAVLKAAVEGKLTEAWRVEHPTTEPASMLLERILKERRARWEADLRAKGRDTAKMKYVEPAVPDMEGLPELPERWCWTTIGQLLIEPPCNGISIKGSDTPPGVPALRLSAMSESGFDYRDRRYIPISEDVAESLAIREGDYFVSRGNGSLHLVGRGTLAQTPPERIVFPDTMIRLLFTDVGLLRNFVACIWSSTFMRVQIETKARTTAGIYKISQPNVESFMLPLPPLLEQKQIVAEIERRLSIVKKLESTIEANLKRAERVRQSILREAFAGRLVPQDPNDEPSSVLLERIGSERGSRERKNGTGVSKGNKGRSVKVPEPEVLDVMGTEQVELWEGVGG